MNLKQICNLVEKDLSQESKFVFTHSLRPEEIKSYRRIDKLSEILEEKIEDSILIENLLVTKIVVKPNNLNSEIESEIINIFNRLSIRNVKLEISDRKDDLVEKLVKKTIVDESTKIFEYCQNLPTTLILGREAFYNLFNFGFISYHKDEIKFLNKIDVLVRDDLKENLIVILSTNEFGQIDQGINLILDEINNLYYLFELEPYNRIKFIELV